MQATSPKSETRRQSGESAASSRASTLTSSPERSMDIQLEPVYAVILVRDSPNATQARVLLPADEFQAYINDFGTPKSIITAEHLEKAARTRAEVELNNQGDTGRLSQNVVVFDTLPIPEGTQPPDDLEPDEIGRESCRESVCQQV